MIYLDNCATTRVFDQAAEQAARFMLKDYCNSSAPYAAALDNEKSFNAFRREIAGSIGAQADEIYFTSGGTESDNTVIFGAADRQRKKIAKKTEGVFKSIGGVIDTAMDMMH